MLRLRVWRLYQPLTLLGLELWQLFLGAVAMTVGLQVGGALPHRPWAWCWRARRGFWR